MGHLPENLPNLLRSHGLRVETVHGWYGRGRPASTGGFNPVGVLCHHTATSRASRDADVVRLLTDGHSDLPGPLSQLGLARDGTVYVIASGRANHAGKARASGTVAAGDGNELYIGIEAFNDGSEGWTDGQFAAYVLLAAVLSVKVTGNSHQTVRAHRETSVTGKWDPGGIDMDEFRGVVLRTMNTLTEPAPTSPEDDMAESDIEKGVNKVLDDDINRWDKGGDARFANLSLRQLLKSIYLMVKEIHAAIVKGDKPDPS